MNRVSIHVHQDEDQWAHLLRHKCHRSGDHDGQYVVHINDDHNLRNVLTFLKASNEHDGLPMVIHELDDQAQILLEQQYGGVAPWVQNLFRLYSDQVHIPFLRQNDQDDQARNLSIRNNVLDQD